MAEKCKAIVIGGKDSRLAKSVLELIAEEDVKFMSPSTSLRDVFKQISKNNSSWAGSVYFQIGEESYLYNISFSRFPIDASRMLMSAKKIINYNKGGC